mmetsp:Transcript_71064/g.132928  ORF Transcript_71064/g.132928 Transcript_71064/m.132928 type:complete len:222 (-) Transcript_71064:1815-2480(-)
MTYWSTTSSSAPSSSSSSTTSSSTCSSACCFQNHKDLLRLPSWKEGEDGPPSITSTSSSSSPLHGHCKFQWNPNPPLSSCTFSPTYSADAPLEFSDDPPVNLPNMLPRLKPPLSSCAFSPSSASSGTPLVSFGEPPLSPRRLPKLKPPPDFSAPFSCPLTSASPCRGLSPPACPLSPWSGRSSNRTPLLDDRRAAPPVSSVPACTSCITTGTRSTSASPCF